MGTLRWEKKAEERAQKRQRQAEFTHKRRELQFAEADLAARIAALQLDLDKQRAELALYTADDEARHVSSDERENTLRKIRGADWSGGSGDALADGVLVTPSLAKVSPAPTSNVIGNLNDTGSVLAALGLSAADLE